MDKPWDLEADSHNEMRLLGILEWGRANFSWRNVNTFGQKHTARDCQKKWSQILSSTSDQEVVSISPPLESGLSHETALTKRTLKNTTQEEAWIASAHWGLLSVMTGDAETTVWGSSGYPLGGWGPHEERDHPQMTHHCSWMPKPRWAEWENHPVLTQPLTAVEASHGLPHLILTTMRNNKMIQKQFAILAKLTDTHPL